MADVPAPAVDELVPDHVIPRRHLPPLRYRDMPEPIPWRRMVGPSIILAGLALGSGEYILWPYIVYKTEFVFFWACLLGVTTQFFVNMEIERWTLATGESAVTGFCRMSRQWAWIMLLLCIVPWAWPGWATGAGKILSWMIFGAVEEVKRSPDGTTQIIHGARYVSWFGTGGLVLTGIVLTSGPVVYNTVEKIQTVLVGLILAVVVLLGVWVVRWDSVVALLEGSVRIGEMPDLGASGLSFMMLLGALAFAGAGGTLNLGQSNYIRDKGYGMGRYIGRITSPITGQEEAVSDLGYHFPHTPENLDRWGRWWRAANVEHFFSFFATCVVCLCLLALVAHSLLYEAPGRLRSEAVGLGSGMDFVWAEATILGREYGAWLRTAFLAVGVAVLLTTELGVLDGVARISTDIVKVNWLRDSPEWTASRLYFLFLWGEIALGSAILLLGGLEEPLLLFKIASAINGGVMFVYSLILLALNNKVLPRRLTMGPVRLVAVVWSCAFFGYFTFHALRDLAGTYLFAG